MNTIRVSNSLDQDQARHFVGPDLDQNCLQKLSTDDKIATKWEIVKYAQNIIVGTHKDFNLFYNNGLTLL